MMPKVCFAPACSIHLFIPLKLVDATGQIKTVQDRLVHIFKGIWRKDGQLETFKNNRLVRS
ncbi:hypothetical protein shim_03890 [Shimia sp. SK013]|nr:hypothetical protein shim_03890 [Shimia sp. SK013]